MHSNIISGRKRLRSVSPTAGEASSSFRPVRIRPTEPTAPKSEAPPINDYIVQELRELQEREPASPMAQAPMGALSISAQDSLLYAQAKAVDEFLDAELAAPEAKKLPNYAQGALFDAEANAVKQLFGSAAPVQATAFPTPPQDFLPYNNPTATEHLMPEPPFPTTQALAAGASTSAAIDQINLKEALEPLCKQLKENTEEEYAKAMMSGHVYKSKHSEQRGRSQLIQNITNVKHKVRIWESDPTKKTELLNKFPYKDFFTPIQTLDVITGVIIDGLENKFKLSDPQKPGRTLSKDFLYKRSNLAIKPAIQKAFAFASAPATGATSLKEALEPLCDRLSELAEGNRYTTEMMSKVHYNNQHSREHANIRLNNNIQRAMENVAIWQQNPTKDTSLLDKFPYKHLLTDLQIADVIAGAITSGLNKSTQFPDPRNPGRQLTQRVLYKRACLEPNPKNPNQLILKDNIPSRKREEKKGNAP